MVNLESDDDFGLDGKEDEGWRVWVHSTPRQLNDRKRPWINYEHSVFTSHLPSPYLTSLQYFKGQRGSLAMHFKTLEVFQTSLADSTST
jgi:hypothetical protein